MEITQAPEAAPEAEAPAEGGAAPAAPAGVDFDAIVDKLENRIGERFTALEERLPAPAPLDETPPDPADVDAFFEPQDFELDGSLTEQAQERHFWASVQQEARTIAQKQVAEALSPLQEERAAERRDQAADALEAKYSELAKPDVQEKVLDAAVRYAQRLGVPQDQVDQVATEPAFIELTYLAMKAESTAAGESAPGAPGVVLEQGGSAGPATGGQDAPDLGDRIVAAAQSQRFRLGQTRG